MSDSVVAFNSVWKRFHRARQVHTLAELVARLPRRLMTREQELSPDQFWAIKDISFAVHQGESFGIVGPNGAGKSTILKLLFRILRPDKGEVSVQGRVGGLIELGAGFHPMLSGRENVFINGSILGMTQKEIRAKYDSIVAFAEIAEFMDMPVKNFSSGMFARLAFAVAAHAEPDVLLVDEVLAVGDAAFQAKCYDRIGKLRTGGSAVVMVSHAMNVMAGMDRVMFLNQGEKQIDGEPRATIDAYLNHLGESGSKREKETSFAETEDGRPRAEFTRIEFLSPSNEPVDKLSPGDGLRIRFHWQCNEPVEAPIFALSLFHDDPRYAVSAPGQYLFHVYSDAQFAGQTVSGAGVAEVDVDAVHLPVGNYRAKVYLYERDGITPIFIQDGAGFIEMERAAYSDARAVIDHRQTWRLPDMANVEQP